MNIKFTLSALALCLALQTAQANPLTRSQAREVAKAFIDIDDNSSDNVPVQPYYVFSRGVGHGYVIVSGDDSTAPIFGYTERGDFDLSLLPVQLKGMLQTFADKVSKIQLHPQAPSGTTIAQRLQRARAGVSGYKQNWENVGTLLTTNWSQGYPYNLMCPYQSNGTDLCATGCEATAAAQIAFYFRKDNPDTILYDTPTGQYASGQPITTVFKAGTPYEWSQMKSSGGGNTRQNNAVALLMAVLGAEGKMQYGASSGAYTSDMGNALSRQFRLDNNYLNKSYYSQTSWEVMVYSNLKQGRPLLYAGSNSEGGHAVVLDGYQSRTGLYHFNFGWGGQGNGFYTVDDSTGMNGFNQWQECLSGFTPRVQKLEGSIVTDQFYNKSYSDLTVKVINKGTLAYSGFKVFCTTGNRLPKQYTFINNDIIVEPRDSATITFSYRPTREQPVRIFLTDANNNIIDSISVPVTQTRAQLEESAIRIASGGETRTVDGMTFQKVNNTTAYVTATLTNSGTYSQPIVRCQVDTYDSDTKTWSRTTSRTNSDSVFAVGATKEVVFAINRLEDGKFYRALLDHEVRAGENSELTFANADTVAFFTVASPDLQVVQSGREATVTGNWDAALFGEQATDSLVTSYDFTGVRELGEQPQVPNPNALFTASDETVSASAAGKLKNIIVNGVCDNLVVETGHELKPSAAFTARHATLVLREAKAGDWNEAVVPFAATVPSGMVVRTVTGITTSKIQMANLTEIAAMQPVIYEVDRNTLNTIEAENVAIGTDTVTTIDTDHGQYIGSTVRNTMGTVAHVFTAEPNQYFFSAVEDSVLEPFRTVVVSSFKRNYSILGQVDGLSFKADRAYRYLADTLNLAYETLAANAGKATPQATATFEQAIAAAELMFTAQQEADDNNINAQADALSAAIKAFLEGVATGIQAIEAFPATSLDANAPVEYYNLSGQRIQQPERGVVIVRQGGKSRKMIVR